MAYRVKTPDGELSYASLYDIERAYAQGLIDPDDEVQQDGSAQWQKVSAIPALRQTRPASATVKRPIARWVALAVGLSALALYLLASGRWIYGLVLVLLVSASLTGLTFKTFRLKRTPTERGP